MSEFDRFGTAFVAALSIARMAAQEDADRIEGNVIQFRPSMAHVLRRFVQALDDKSLRHMVIALMLGRDGATFGDVVERCHAMSRTALISALNMQPSAIAMYLDRSRKAG